jgi:myosin-light-chain kinase
MSQPGPPQPEPSSMLFSAGQPIQYARSACEAGVAKLHVQDALPEDHGTYTCLAENTLGQVSCSAKVTVHGRSLQVPH